MATDDILGGLSAAQQGLISALLGHKTKADAARAAHVSQRQMYRWLNDPLFLAAFHKARREAFRDFGTMHLIGDLSQVDDALVLRFFDRSSTNLKPVTVSEHEGEARNLERVFAMRWQPRSGHVGQEPTRSFTLRLRHGQPREFDRNLDGADLRRQGPNHSRWWADCGLADATRPAAPKDA
jgi:hypothetical protein